MLLAGFGTGGNKPFAYLRYLFSKLPLTHSQEALHALLPNRVKHATIEAFENQAL